MRDDKENVKQIIFVKIDHVSERDFEKKVIRSKNVHKNPEETTWDGSDEKNLKILFVIWCELFFPLNLQHLNI